MRFRPSIVVVAAGRGSRFGSSAPDGLPKLEQPFGTSTVLGTTVRNAVQSQLPVVVVTTQAFADVARRSVAARDVIVLPEVGTPGQEALGMGYSISSGVSAIPDAGGWLILPGDMPMVRSDTMLEVARELADHAVVFAQHKGVRGHPVGFSTELYSELVTLRGDDRRTGFVDMTQALRSPGSTLKPFVYGLAFDEGLAHPETLIDDRPVAFGTYAPQNFDKLYLGTIRMREALEAGFEAAFAEARPLIEASPRFISIEIRRPTGTGQPYLLLAEWRSIADHRDGFRKSGRYLQWRALLHPFYDPMPTVDYFGDVL